MTRHRSLLFAAVLLAVTAVWTPAAAAEATTEPTASDEARVGNEPGERDGDTTTPVKHFISLMQENHTFDNYFGTYPGADGFPEDACVPRDPKDPAAGCAEPFKIGGKAVLDLGHNDEVFQRQFNDGAMDGFLKVFDDTPAVGDLPVGYYDDEDLPYYWNLADNFVLFDNFFTSAHGGSVRNHFYWVAGHPGNTKADSLLPEGFDHVPTIFDRLHEADVSWKFYIENYDPNITFRNLGRGDRGAQIVWAPILNYNRFLDNEELNSRIVPLEEFYEDLISGSLPAVSYMVPSGASEHPPGSIQAGQSFVRSLLTALMRSEYWESSALMWTYDDWGGWYDHVAPPQVDRFGYGFRAPALLVSPYARRGHVDSTQLDFTSMLKFIEENWGLEPLAKRDAEANNITTAFDFDQRPRAPVMLPAHREETVIEPSRSEMIYALYGGSLGLAAVLVGFARATTGRVRRRRGRRR